MKRGTYEYKGESIEVGRVLYRIQPPWIYHGDVMATTEHRPSPSPAVVIAVDPVKGVAFRRAGRNYVWEPLHHETTGWLARLPEWSDWQTAASLTQALKEARVDWWQAAQRTVEAAEGRVDDAARILDAAQRNRRDVVDEALLHLSPDELGLPAPAHAEICGGVGSADLIFPIPGGSAMIHGGGSNLEVAP